MTFMWFFTWVEKIYLDLHYFYLFIYLFIFIYFSRWNQMWKKCHHQRTRIHTIIAGVLSLIREWKFNSFLPFLKPKKNLTSFLWVFFLNVSIASFYLSQNKVQLFVDLWFIGVRRIHSKIPVACREIRMDDGTFHHNFHFKPTTRQIYLQRWHHFSGFLGSLVFTRRFKSIKNRK